MEHYKCLVHFKCWSACYELFKELNDYLLVFSPLSHEFLLVVNLGKDVLCVKRITQNFFTQKHELENCDESFDCLDDLLNYYHENYLYDHAQGLVTRFKLRKPVYSQVPSLKHWAEMVASQKTNKKMHF